jgi:hypothetical protein
MSLDKFPQSITPPLRGELVDPEELDSEFVRRMAELPTVISEFYTTAANNKSVMEIVHGGTEFLLQKTNQELVEMFVRVNPEYKTPTELMQEIEELDKNVGSNVNQYTIDPLHDAKDITPKDENDLISVDKYQLSKPEME